MNASDIKQLIERKKNGEKIVFLDCPTCRKFFGTTEPNVATCSPECQTKYIQKKEQLEAYRNALRTYYSNQNNSAPNERVKHKKFGKRVKDAFVLNLKNQIIK